jgi:hypothetical protein
MLALFVLIAMYIVVISTLLILGLSRRHQRRERSQLLSGSTARPRSPRD